MTELSLPPVQSWTPVGPGKLARPVWGGEKLCDAVDLFVEGHFNLAIAFKVVTSLPADRFVERIPKAWVSLRKLHPQIACTLEEDETRPPFRKCIYQVPRNEEEAREWLEKTTFFHPHAEHAKLYDDLMQSRHVSVDGFAACVHWTAPQVAQHGSRTSVGMVLHFNHTMLDAGGVNIIIAAFVKALLGLGVGSIVDEAWGNEIKRLPCTVLATFGLEKPSAEADALLAEQLAELQQNAPGIVLPLPDGDLSSRPWRADRARITLSKADTRRLVNGCKSRGITVTTALVAALAVGMIEMCPLDSSSGFALPCIVDSRRWLDPSLPFAPPGFCAFMPFLFSRVFAKVVRTSDPEDVTDEKRKLLDAYAEKWASELAKCMQTPIITQCSDGICEALIAQMQNAGPNPPIEPVPGVTSLGVIDQRIPPRLSNPDDGSSLEIDDWSFFARINTPSPWFMLWTFDSEFNFQLQFNHHWLEPSMVHELAARIKANIGHFKSD